MNTSSPATRRHFLQSSALGSAALGLSPAGSGLPSAAVAQASASPAPSAARPPLNRFPRMMQDWLVDRVREAEAAGDARRAALKTKEDAEAYVRDVRARIAHCFGPLPEKTPLNARITSTQERDAYRIDCLVYESRPGYLVTGNLYVPKGGNEPRPAVVGVCGHSYNGKAEKAYQSFAQGLARMGYIVLIIDPVGQGERFQYLKSEPGKGLMSRYGGGTGEHIRMGNQLALVGEFIGTWFVWDAMRAVDYLNSRPDVDQRHIGITGNSGGGTQATWLCGMEPRFTMGAPSCFVTTFRRNAENELPADTEQCPPRVLAEGLDHSDFLAAMAPKPVIVMAQEKDYFDARGSKTTYDRLLHLYTLLGHPERVRLHVGPDPHGYTQPNREAMYAFFNEATGVSSAKTEPALVIEPDEKLLCAPEGQVERLGSRTLTSFTRELAAKARQPSRPLAARIREALRLPEKIAVPDYRIPRPVGSRGYPAKSSVTYAVESEGGIHALVTRLTTESHYSRIPAGQKRAILYIAHHSADAELRGEPLIADLIKGDPEAAVFACDVRGIGESRPNTCGSGDTFLAHYGSDYFYAAHGVMLDRPVLGQRTRDALAVIALLAATGHEHIHLAGRGWGALPAAFAAALAPEVRQVTLKNHLTSYRDVVADDDYRWPYALLPFGVLHLLDLPEVYGALKAKGLSEIEPWGAQGG